MTDLVVLVPDRNMEQAVSRLLERPADVGIRPISHQVYVHSRRDPGCVREAHDFLRPFTRVYDYALVMFDHEGSGRETEQPAALAGQVRERLWRNGWSQRAGVVVLVPELEVWVWSASPHVESCLGWAGRQPSLRTWLEDRGHWPTDGPKPAHPKEALEAALYQVRKPRSSAVYAQLAQRVSLSGHTEPAFLDFVRMLQGWFAL
jgi:hypothetical protein